MLTKTKLMTNANEKNAVDPNEIIDNTDVDVEDNNLQANDETYESGDTDTTSDEESEVDLGEETSEDGSQDGDTISVSKSEYEKLRRESAAAKRLREKVGKKDSDESKESSPSLDQELISRTYLAAQAGIKEPEIQDEALRLADKFGMSIAQAMNDPDISIRLKNLQKQAETKRAIARGTGGSATRNKDASYYADYFKKNGDFPDGTPNSMIAKVMQEYS